MRYKCRWARCFVAFSLFMLLVACGPSKVEVENQSLKQQISQLTSQIQSANLTLREKDLEIQSLKNTAEQEKYQLVRKIDQLSNQLALLGSSQTDLIDNIEPIPSAIEDVYLEEFFSGSIEGVDGNLRLVDAFEKCPYLKEIQWEVQSSRLIIAHAIVDSGEISGRNALRNVLLGILTYYGESWSSYLEDIPGSSLVSSFVGKATKVSIESVIDNVSQENLDKLQAIIRDNLPPYRISIEFALSRHSSPIIRSAQFIIQNNNESDSVVEIPSESLPFIVLDIATNDVPVAMTVLMLHEKALSDIKEYVANLMK